MNTEELLIKFNTKIEEEGISKKQFIDTYCKGMLYGTVNMQLLGYNKLKRKVREAIEKYLEE